ncbi:MAG: GTPase HflX [Proteobacteria bacterium]|nr:GTPase HflX [Pseudomonadota bacterium]
METSQRTQSRTLVLHPVFKQKPGDVLRQPEACLEEAVGLAHAIDLDIVATALVSVAQPKPATLFGTGKVEDIRALVEQHEAGLAIVNHSLSPVQQRNLEKAWNCKVIDRTALILEIFGARARTHEGKLQVELAALDYQKSRLVRSWTHLERQRGGFGFLGGPGESQIEIDRRLIRDRMAKLRRQLEQVTRTRELHRKVRRDTPYPVVALVGYTNAGKSTLFNLATGASVLSMDKLFATLDPTMRVLSLPGGGKAILSDTVGFVSDLPTQLVAAFRATLEEVLEADVLLHIRDCSHPDTEAQKQDVEAVLKNLFGKEQLPDTLIEVMNKIDRLPPEQKAALAEKGAVMISAVTGEGVPQLLERIAQDIEKRFYTPAEYRLPTSDGKSLAWLHAHGKVVEQQLEDGYIQVRVQLSPENIRRFEQMQHALSH